MLESELPNFILASEGASADCGLLVTDGTLPAIKVTDRISAVTEQYGEKARAIILDFKTINLYPSRSRNGGTCYYKICIQPRQKQVCAALIIQNPAAPLSVAVLPYHYIEQRHGNLGTGKISYLSREGPLSGRQVEPFPTEWSPFIMPLYFLPEALRLLPPSRVGRDNFGELPHVSLD